jgi:hypothetical protein
LLWDAEGEDNNHTGRLCWNSESVLGLTAEHDVEWR